MNIIFMILPVVTAILVMLIKWRFVRPEDKKIFAIRELVIDSGKFFIISLVLISSNLFADGGKSIYYTMSIDIIMLLVFLLFILRGKYNYANRKTITGIVSGLLIALVLIISMFKMLFGPLDVADKNILFILTLKAVSYFFVSLWATISFEAEEGSTIIAKIKYFLINIIDNFKKYNLSRPDFYLIAILGLFLFVGDPNNSFVPICIFGIHEILRRKYLKGCLYIVAGNLILIFSSYLIAQMLFIVYVLVALLDISWQFKNYNKKLIQV